MLWGKSLIASVFPSQAQEKEEACFSLRVHRFFLISICSVVIMITGDEICDKLFLFYNNDLPFTTSFQGQN